MEFVYRICVLCGNDGTTLADYAGKDYICAPCEEEIYKEEEEQ